VLVSPTNSDPALFRDEPGAPPVTGHVGYASVYPADDVDIAAGALVARRYGRVFYLEDEYGRQRLNWTWFRRAARRADVTIAGHEFWDPMARDYGTLARQVRASGADAVYIASELGPNTGQVVHDLRGALSSGVRIIGGHGLLPVSLLYSAAGPSARGLLFTSATPSALGPAGQAFARTFAAREAGHPVGDFDLHAAAATEVLLAAIARSDGTRGGAARALRRLRLTDSALGPLALDARGQPVEPRFTVMRVEHGGGSDVANSTEGAEPVGTVDPPVALVSP
jgi:branched-chain amino acid transport system substrate-binding protein